MNLPCLAVLFLSLIHIVPEKPSKYRPLLGAQGVQSHFFPALATNLRQKAIAPTISIRLISPKLAKGEVGLVNLRIVNTTAHDVYLWKGCYFLLFKDGSDRHEFVSDDYIGFVPLWKYVSELSKPDKNGILHPGETIACDVDLTELGWKLTRYSKDATLNLFKPVPAGTYNLQFSLNGPQKVLNGKPITERYKSNNVPVVLEY